MPATEGAVSAALGGPVAGGRRVLFSAMKNEAPFILEWVAYHLAIGFDRIVVCSNPSTDGTNDLLDALEAAGALRHLRVEVAPGRSPQACAADAFARDEGLRDGDWYLWLDADEFLNIHAGEGRLDDLLAALGPAQGILLNWRIFGSNGHARFPGRFVSRDFMGASAAGFEPNLEIKTLFRKSPSVAGWAQVGINRPLLTGQAPLMFLNGRGGGLDMADGRHRRWQAGKDFARTNRVGADEFGWSLAQVNHYVVRTPEFFALKRLRGRGWAVGQAGDRNRRHTPEFFATHDRNEVQDDTILRWSDAVTAGIDRLRAHPAVARALDVVALRVAEDLARVADAAAAAPAPPAAAEFKLTFPPEVAAFVREAYAAAGSILEYGSGGSTVLAAELGKPVVSVESDRAWAARLADHLQQRGLGRAAVHHADIGPTKAWGRPQNDAAWRLYPGYAVSVWDRPDLIHPDLVLIDGRFRAACFAAVAARIIRPVRVLFDDYADRPFYHKVEAIAPRSTLVGRLAVFDLAPGRLSPAALTRILDWFGDPA